MKAYIFFSVHERLFDPVAEQLRERWGVDQFCGTVWGRYQERWLRRTSIRYEPLQVFTRDVLPSAIDGAPDFDFLAERERDYGISLHRMIFSERHLQKWMSYRQLMRLAEVTIKGLEKVFDSARPDFAFTEDISCLTSYLHFAEARRRGIPYWIVGSARLPYRLSVYGSGLQHWERTNERFEEIRRVGLTIEQRAAAVSLVESFRNKPVRPTGMETRARPPSVGRRDFAMLSASAMRYFGDPKDPTAIPPHRAISQRVWRLARQRGADLFGLFDRPLAGERYVIYPIHFQPEASTLVQAPYYLDQVGLIEDIAKSLPTGYVLYVKEHLSNRGRRSLEFYRQIRRIFGVRLLGPDEDTWSLLHNASAVAVITGTMGWEGLLFDKPVITFGDVFYNVLPHVYRAGELSKDRWHDLFRIALANHRPDRETLLSYVSALQQTSFPGFMKNPNTFPQVTDPKNVRNIADAIGSAAGLKTPCRNAWQDEYLEHECRS